MQGLVALFLTIVLVASCASPGPLNTAPREPAGIAKDLQAPPDEAAVMVIPATGVQIYECRAKAGAKGFEWTFVGPEATLFDAFGQKIGTHYGGPTWEANDGCKVKGAVTARQDAKAGHIPWLLLSATADATGAFAGVTSIQRVNTAGGVAPATGCNLANVGKTARVSYTADYYFYRKK